MGLSHPPLPSARHSLPEKTYPTFELLPFEIVEDIARILDRQDLLALLFVSHSTHDIFEPLLYVSLDTSRLSINSLEYLVFRLKSRPDFAGNTLWLKCNPGNDVTADAEGDIRARRDKSNISIIKACTNTTHLYFTAQQGVRYPPHVEWDLLKKALRSARASGREGDLNIVELVRHMPATEYPSMPFRIYRCLDNLTLYDLPRLRFISAPVQLARQLVVDRPVERVELFHEIFDRAVHQTRILYETYLERFQRSSAPIKRLRLSFYRWESFHDNSISLPDRTSSTIKPFPQVEELMIEANDVHVKDLLQTIENMPALRRIRLVMTDDRLSEIFNPRVWTQELPGACVTNEVAWRLEEFTIVRSEAAEHQPPH